MLDFTNVIAHRDFHKTLIWLGKIPNWLESSSAGGTRTANLVNKHAIINTPGFEQHQALIKRVVFDTDSSMQLMFLHACSIALTQGPKIFQPTHEQFESMQHVDLKIPIADYKQPYPCVVIEIPKESRIDLGKKCNIDVNDCPKYVLVHNYLTKEKANIVFICQHFPIRDIDIFHVFQDRPEFETLEQAITTRVRVEIPVEHDFAETAARASLNLMLMLVHYGFKDGGPLDRVSYEKHRKRKDLEKFKHADFRTVNMISNVVIRKEEKICRVGDGSDKELKPHWRRGHWKNQHYGTNNALVKRIFINPVLVRSDRAVGDLAESRTFYKV